MVMSLVLLIGKIVLDGSVHEYGEQTVEAR